MSQSQRSSNVTPTGDEDVETRVYSLALTATNAAAFPEVQGTRAVTVVNPLENAVDVLVGDSGSQPIRLYPGDDMRVRCTRLNQVYVKNASSATQTVYGVAEVRA